MGIRQYEITIGLSGGAARGAYHIGVLTKFDELGIKIKALSGASIGSFISVAYASGIKPKEILEIIKTDDFKKAFGINLPFNKSIAKIDIASKIIQNLLKFKNLEELNIPVHLSAADLKSGEVVYFDKGDMVKIVLGSCAIVPFLEAIRYENYILVDGCYKDNLPIKPLEKYEIPIVAVDLKPITNFEKENIVSTTVRALQIALTPSRTKLSKRAIYITSPELDKFSLVSFKKFDALFELGYNAVNTDVINEIKEKYDNNGF